MSKRLKTLIFISSFFVVALILGVVLIGLIGNISTIQVNDFRVYEATNVFSASSGLEQIDVYLSNSKLSKSQSILSDYVAENYVLSADDEQICTVSKENGANILTAKAVGSTFVRVKDKVLSAQNFYTETEVKVVQVNVYAEMTTVTLNLLSSETNRLAFVLKTQANAGGINIAFASSDPSVAKMISDNGDFYVEYYKAGTATLSIYCVDNPSLKDTVIVNVVDKEPDDLYFVDEAGTKVDRKTMYADGSYYTINYELLFGSKRASEIGGINGENIRVLDTGIKSLTLLDFKTSYVGTNGEAKYEYTAEGITKRYTVAPFDGEDSTSGAGVVLDKANRCLKLKKTYRPEDNVAGTGDEEKQLKDVMVIVTLQTYTYIDGVEVVTGTYQIPVYIYRKIVIDIEVEVAGRPQDFDDTVKNVVNYHESDKIWGDLSWKGKTIKSVSNLYMTEAGNNAVRTIYIKVYRVYNNGEREQINPNMASFRTVGSVDVSSDALASRMYTAPDTSFTALKIEKCLNDGSKTKKVLEIEDSGLMLSLEVTFDTVANINKGINLEEDNADYKKEGTYVYNKEKKTYEFTYFDERMRSDLEYTDSLGNIIAIRNDTGA